VPVLETAVDLMTARMQSPSAMAAASGFNMTATMPSDGNMPRVLSKLRTPALSPNKPAALMRT